MESLNDIPGLTHWVDANDPSTILMSADNIGFVHTLMNKAKKEKKMDQIDISKIVSKHGKWAHGEEGGERANLMNADLRGAELVDVDLRRANLSGVNLKGEEMCYTNLSGTDLNDANLRGADLKEAKICYASLKGVSLRSANLSSADLSGADLWGAKLRGANLKDANLYCTNLKCANLSHANLSHANLKNADLGRSNLMEANLPETVKVFNLFTKIKTAIEDGGALKVGDYRQDEKTHSLAGWVTTLAGEGGRVAENLLGASCAAVLIINESCPYLEGKMPDFYDSNVFSNSDEMIMNFINECAEKEKVGLDG